MRHADYDREAVIHGGDRKSSGQNVHLISTSQQNKQSANYLHSAKTADVIAQEYGVTGTTIRNDAAFPTRSPLTDAPRPRSVQADRLTGYPFAAQ